MLPRHRFTAFIAIFALFIQAVGLQAQENQPDAAPAAEEVTPPAKVDAAKLIARATAELSEQRAIFNKKEDSLVLLKDILARRPEKLEPLCEYVKGLVVAVTTAS